MSLTRRFVRGILRESQSCRLHSRRQFREALQRERARSDRSGDILSLLTLGVKNWDEGRATMLYVVKVLRRRLRLTDEAGWLDGRRIGVLLPRTPIGGAWTLADDLCMALPAHIPLPECKVYCYPSDYLPDEPRREQRQTDMGVRVAGPRPVEAMDAFFLCRTPAWKRGLDMAVASLGLVLAAPLMLLVAAAIKLTSPGPALFAQRRSGLGGRPFMLYKLRSMNLDAERRKAELMAMNEQDGPAFKIKNDPRVTRIGCWLRAASLDELPQLWNVLRGDMSLVGPRPLPCHEAQGCRGWQRRRLDVTPGLTCTWQIRGRSRVSFAEWIRMDLRYIDSLSLWTDLKLLVLTIPALVLRRGY